MRRRGGWRMRVSRSARAVITSVFFDAADAFGDGILAGAPAASGTFTWPVQ